MKPMLAATSKGGDIRFPCLASPKLDGIRCVVFDDLRSRTLKPIRNKFTQGLFGHLRGLDGELIVGEATGNGVFARSTSGVMSTSGKPDVRFFVFDCFTDPKVDFALRLEAAARICEEQPQVVVVQHTLCSTQQELSALDDKHLELGYEGTMVRDPKGVYKFGRSTLREGGLLKLKWFADSEAIVVGYVEKMHNGNAAFLDERGYTKRSSHQENKWGVGTLGALQVRDLASGVEFEVGTGFDDALREALWAERPSLVGRIVKYKFFSSGIKEKPRHPVFLGFRHPDDIGG